MQFERLIGFLMFSVTACLNQPAYAAETECKADALYIGAPLRPALDLSAIPTNRTISNDPFPPEQAELLNQTFDRLFESTDATAASISIWKPGVGYWSREKGTVNAGMNSFWWASTGKLATATVILQLIDEGKLASDTSVSTFFPDFKHASVATVDDLLHHTSGIFSFNIDLKYRKKKGYSPPSELIGVADKHDLEFCPGTNWNYSNTGYVMLAAIAEKIEQKPFAEVIEQRIAKPIGLETFRVLQPGYPASSVVTSSSKDAEGVPEIASIFGAGGIVATPSDMIAFLHGYLETGLVPQSVRDDAVTKLYPMFGTPMSYGSGIMVIDVPDKDVPTIWIGHSGGSSGAKGLLFYDVKRDTYIAIALDNQAPAEAIANTLLKLMD